MTETYFTRTEFPHRHAVMLRVKGDDDLLLGYAIKNVLGTWDALDPKDRDVTRSPEHPMGVRFISREAVANRLLERRTALLTAIAEEHD
jgi:hypothetical protein